MPRTETGRGRPRAARRSNPSLKKSLGQHHLVDGQLCRPLVDFLAPADERVLEIGPGGGVLTAELLAAGARVTACELDLEWAFELRRAHRHDSLQVAVVDAATIPWQHLPSGTMVTGNLPFNVGTRMVESLLPHGQQVPRAGFMLQKEVAERLAAGPGEEAYGSLSVLVAAWARARLLGSVKPGSFRPPPKVWGAYVGLELQEPPLPRDQMPEFTRFVRQAFAQRRKTLRNSLRSMLPPARVEAALEGLGLEPAVRAEVLGLESFVALYEVLQTKP